MYWLVRNILFLFPPETIHHFSMKTLRGLCRIGLARKLLTSWFSPGDKKFECKVFGLQFPNPVGLGAGFDKNACYLRELEALGFGFIEIGTVTPLPQPGNDKPRLFRLKKDRALINRMGFNNDGVQVISERLKRWKTGPKKPGTPRLIIGGNIGKNKITPNQEAWKDYEICFRELFDQVDYFVVNVSSPNTPGLRELQEKDFLEKILSNLQAINRSHSTPKPLLLKISPDLSDEQLDDVLVIARQTSLDGLVVANTTTSRLKLQTESSRLDSIGGGGLSGLPVKEKSTAMIRYIKTNADAPVNIIASGGIFNYADAKEKLDAGASLVQVWTGFIYKGPAIVKKILSCW